MGSVNKVILVGNLGRDAELRYTPGGAAVATINMATTEVWNDKAGQRQEKTEWHRVVLWGKSAESLTEYLTKGKQIYVEGRLQTRQRAGSPVEESVVSARRDQEQVAAGNVQDGRRRLAQLSGLAQQQLAGPLNHMQAGRALGVGTDGAGASRLVGIEGRCHGSFAQP